MSAHPDERSPSWAVELTHPAPLAAVVVLVLNDHWLKHAAWFPRPVSGKLSDVAGLLFFPVLLFAVADGALRAMGATAARRAIASGQGRAVAAIAAAVVTGVVFSALKLSPGANRWVSGVWGPIALDRTDLAALPALVLGAMWVTRRELGRTAPAPRWMRAMTVLLAAGASLATTPSPVKYDRPYPAWRIVDGNKVSFACADLVAWFSKSGKQGAGVTVRVAGRSAGSVRVVDARFELGPASYPMVDPLAPIDATADSVADLYLPFSFDGDDAWRHGKHDGVVVIRVSACGEDRTLRMPAVFAAPNPLYPPTFPPPAPSVMPVPAPTGMP